MDWSSLSLSIGLHRATGDEGGPESAAHLGEGRAPSLIDDGWQGNGTVQAVLWEHTSGIARTEFAAGLTLRGGASHLEGGLSTQLMGTLLTSNGMRIGLSVRTVAAGGAGFSGGRHGTAALDATLAFVLEYRGVAGELGVLGLNGRREAGHQPASELRFMPGFQLSWRPQF